MTEASTLGKPAIAVVILTLDEERNLPQALDSVVGWADEVFVLDSFSTDQTPRIAERYGCRFFQHRFEDYAKQRNHAIQELPIESEWVFFLDADEWMTRELKQEISERIAAVPEENGFFVKWRFIWMGRWIRRGYYPTWILRMFRRSKARCEERSVNEHMVVEGKTGYLTHDFVHEDHNGIGEWVAKHNRYATAEALALASRASLATDAQIEARAFGSQAQRKRWLRHRVWNRLPPLLRPLLYFLYRYVMRGGFLDGRAAFVYHFMQALWFPLLIDVKYMELERARRASGVTQAPSDKTDQCAG